MSFSGIDSGSMHSGQSSQSGFSVKEGEVSKMKFGEAIAKLDKEKIEVSEDMPSVSTHGL